MATPQADPADVGPVPVARTVLGALRCLARNGAYAVLRAEACVADGDYAVYASGPAERALAILPAAVVAQARGSGWLATDAEGRLRICAAGLKALRRTSASSAGGGRGRGGPRRAIAVASAHASHETPLAWLRRRKDKDGRRLITQAQYDAGERLAADFRNAQISRRVTSDWSGMPAAGRTRRAAPGAGIDISDAVAAAHKRIERALSAVGSDFAGILIDVCCFETGLETAERAKGWPQRSAKLILQFALTALARHYGLIAPDVPPIARLRHWGDSDYRPGIDAWR